MARVIGAQQLQARLHAASSTQFLMKQLGTMVVAEAKRNTVRFRKTGNLGRSIHVASTTATSATVVAGAGYAAYVELGTRAHEITPKAAKALRWAASPAGRRLSGSPRVGAAVIFAKRVHHPGTKPQPYLLPAAKSVVAKAGLTPIVDAWNRAG